MMYEENALFYNGKYKLEKNLGDGGFSDVWRALDRDSGKTVAIKIFHKQDQRGNDLCQAEFVRMQDLKHKHIVYPEVIANWENAPFIAMPYYPAGDVEHLIGKLDERGIAEMIYQVGSALASIHNRPSPVLHNDIKPNNILVDKDRQYLLTDFGISEQLQEQFLKTLRMELQSSANLGGGNRLTRKMMTIPEAEEMVGMTPPPYRAPELFKQPKERPVKATDIWSFGATIYQMITGHPPCEEQGGLLMLIQTKNPKVKSQDLIPPLPNHFSKGLEKWLIRCLSINPWDRPTASQIVAAADIYLRRDEWPKVPSKPNDTVAQSFQIADIWRNPTSKILVPLFLLIASILFFVQFQVKKHYHMGVISLLFQPDEVPPLKGKPWTGITTFIPPQALDLSEVRPKDKAKLAQENDAHLTAEIMEYFTSNDTNLDVPVDLEYTTAIINGRFLDNQEFIKFLKDNKPNFVEVEVLDRQLRFEAISDTPGRFLFDHINLKIWFR